MPNSEDIRAFLDRSWPAMLGVVGTIQADGSPHVVPVWYRYDGETVTIWTHAERGWVKNLARDNRVAFSVQEDQPPFAAVLIRGRAEIITDDRQEVRVEIRRITERYIEAADVDSYIQNWTHLKTIVRIKPEKIIAWGRGY
jgi:PPOX class probable F420-dependent enzyme